MDDKEIKELLEESGKRLTKARYLLEYALNNAREYLKGKPLKNLTSKHQRYNKLLFYICDYLDKVNENTTTLEALDMAKEILGKVYATLYTMPRQCKYEIRLWEENRKRYLGGLEASRFYEFFLIVSGVQVSLDDLFVYLTKAYCMSKMHPHGEEMRCKQ